MHAAIEKSVALTLFKNLTVQLTLRVFGTGNGEMTYLKTFGIEPRPDFEKTVVGYQDASYFLNNRLEPGLESNPLHCRDMLR